MKIPTRAAPCLMAMTALAILCSCKEQKKTDDGPRVFEKGMPLDIRPGQSRQTAEILRMGKVAGRWQSQPGVFTDGRGQSLVLDISNDRNFSLQVREPVQGKDHDAIDIDVRGSLNWTQSGVLVARGEGARPPIAEFSSWRGTFPAPGKITISAGPRSYTLSYHGL